MEKLELKKHYAYAPDVEGTNTLTVQRVMPAPNAEGYRQGHDFISFLVNEDEENTEEQREVLISIEEAKSLITALQDLVTPF